MVKFIQHLILLYGLAENFKHSTGFHRLNTEVLSDINYLLLVQSTPKTIFNKVHYHPMYV